MTTDNYFRPDDEIRDNEKTIDGKPYWVKDRVDEIINFVLTGNSKYTFSMLKNRILDFLIKDITEGKSLRERIEHLTSIGVLKKEPKETNIELISLYSKEKGIKEKWF